MVVTATAVKTVDTTVGRPEIEKWLRDNGVTEFEFRPKLSLSKIDRKASRTNQARPLHPIDEDWVLILMEALQNDAGALPPIVVEQMSNGKFKILDGNHRDEAARLLEITNLPAYVITQKLTETQERVLAMTGNTRHGLSLDLDTRVRHAVWLIEARNMKFVDAAKAVGAPEHRVRHMVQLERASRRAAAVDHRATARLSGGTRMRLDNIRNDVVHEAVTKLAVETNMSQVDVNGLVSTVNKENAEQKQLAVVEAERKRREKEILASAGGKVPMPVAFRSVRTTLGRAMRIDIKALKDASVDPEVRKQLKAQAKDAISKLDQLVKAL
jgi:ParB-like chromosome segregation protein Spo0J